MVRILAWILIKSYQPGVVDEGASHLLELSALAQKDPEFYKYLQENDRELLQFDGDGDAGGSDEDDENEGFEMDLDGADDEQLPILTKEILKGWQKALLEVLAFSLLIDPNTDSHELRAASLSSCFA